MIRAACLALFACLLATHVEAAGMLRVIGWSDYVAPDVLDAFTKTTGVGIVYDTYNTSEELETRLAARDAPYDVVIASAQPLQRGVESGFFQTLDRTRLPHAKTLLPDVMARLAQHDPGNAHAVNYMWFPTGIAYDVEKARERLGGADPATALASWNTIFDPSLANKFSDCGIAVRDSAQDMFAEALGFLKLSPSSTRPADYTRAASLLFRTAQSMKLVDPDNLPAALAGGEECIAVANASEWVQARDRAAGATPPVAIGFAVPKEGALIWLDNLAIPVNAHHTESAYRFIDFLLQPDNAARNSAVTHFANSVGADSGKTPEATPGLFTLTLADKQIEKIVGRFWSRLKTIK